MPKFKDPKTGQIVNVNNFLVFLSCLLFGLFFFLYIGETQHALVMVGFAILITLVGIFVSPIAILYAYVFPLIYSFIAPKIVKDKWLNKGYIKHADLLTQEETKVISRNNNRIIIIISLILMIINLCLPLGFVMRILSVPISMSIVFFAYKEFHNKIKHPIMIISIVIMLWNLFVMLLNFYIPSVFILISFILNCSIATLTFKNIQKQTC